MKNSVIPLLVLLVVWTACAREEPAAVQTTETASGVVLPVLLIDTAGGSIHADDKISASLKVIEQHDGTLRDITRQPASVQSNVGIELHGETSLQLPKKSYDFEFQDDQGDDRELELLGMPRGSDWTLKGCGRDETCLRDALALAIARDFGRYAPRTRFVELYLNGEYRGLYVLMEKIRRDKWRVDVPRPAADASRGDLTGGYIFKLDIGEGLPDDELQRDWVSPVTQLVYSYHYPRYDRITSAQRTYLEDFVARFETVMAGDEWNDLKRGYRAWIDVPSWVDFGILQELSNNVDAYFKSVYIHKRPASQGNLLAMGPVWDFDAAFGIGDFRGGRSVDVWTHQMNQFGTMRVPYDPPGETPFVPAYWERLWSDAAFLDDVKCRWEELRRGPLAIDALKERIDTWVAELATAQPRDNALWHQGDDAGYRGEIEHLKAWLEQRTAWLDANLRGTCQAS